MTNDIEKARINMLRHNLQRLTKMLTRKAEALEQSEQVFVPPPKSEKDETVVQTEVAPTQKKGRAAVVCWDLGHNPVGRAMVIYDLLAKDWDVELIGPLWSQFGGKIWGPIAQSGRRVRTLVCDDLTDFYPAAIAFAETNAYDLVVACKPRAPSLALAALIKKNSNCPMIMDIDDLELSFADEETPIAEKDFASVRTEALRLPYQSTAIRYCEGLTGEADSLIVSNIALRERYGGHMIRHARDERTFDPSFYDRNLARKKLDLKPSEFALMFVGTPRPHKGIYTVAAALDEMNDKRFVLNIVGDINYPDMRKKLEGYSNARINFFPDCSFADLPLYLMAADAVPLMQDWESLITQYQIPAKISDATAFGLPVIATEVPPLYDLEQQNLITVIHPDYLPETLNELYQARKSKSYGAEKQRIRAGFEDEFGMGINRIRLDNAIARAIRNNQGSLSPKLEKLLDHFHQAYLNLNRDKPVKAAAPKAGKTDIVMFWKQNDSGLYGRRSDMIMKHLLASNKVGRILQFDAPINLQELSKLIEKSDGPLAPTGLTARNAVKNKLGLNDRSRHFLRTFIWSDIFRKSSLIDGTSMDVYPAYIQDQMEALGFNPDNTIAWVCPVVHDFPQVQKRINFSGIVCDIIDDQRAFDLTQSERRRVEKNYEDILPLADLVMTNCQPNVEAFSPLTEEIHFVPNGTEIPPEGLPMPSALENIARPIAGYVGNLQDRIDWDLLEEAAEHVPDVSFVIAGGGANPENIERLDKLPNVHFIGVVPYEKVQAYIAHFDVCIVPHKGTDLTRRMNPLKVYNYFSAAKPIVTTEVENIDGNMIPYIRFAKNAGELAVFIKESLEHPIVVNDQYKSILSEISWESRIAHIASILDEKWPTIKEKPKKMGAKTADKKAGKKA
ncbi:MAG: glycosyltransferase [Hellea sp.]|nr:glycosyltransferase [Hellea sp.]